MSEPPDLNAVEILDALPERVVRYRLPGLEIVYCNNAWAAGHLLTRELVIGRDLRDFLTPDGLRGLERQLALLGPDNPVLADESPREDLTSPGRWLEWVDRFLPSDEIIAVGRDVTARHLMEIALMDSEARFRELADHSSDMVFRFLAEPAPHFDYLSPSVGTITGHDVSIFLEDFWAFVAMLDDESRALVARVIAGEPVPDRFDISGSSADGSTMTLETHLTRIAGGFQGVASDVTELRRLQRELAEQALHDPLTGLANRRLVDELLAVGVARAQRQGSLLAVAFVDLDAFKAINDTHGHAGGDVVLREAARRLQDNSRQGDVVGRLGGDEFIVVFEPDESGSRSLLDRLDRILSQPIELQPGQTVQCRGSIGYADTRRVGYDAAELLAAADADMYAVKRAHRQRQPATPA